MNDELGSRRQIRDGRRHLERALLAGREDERVAAGDDSQGRRRNDLDFERIAAVVEPHLVRMPGQIGERNFQSWGRSLVVWREFNLQLRSRTDLGGDFDAVDFVRTERPDAELTLFEPNRTDRVGIGFEQFQVGERAVVDGDPAEPASWDRRRPR